MVFVCLRRKVFKEINSNLTETKCTKNYSFAANYFLSRNKYKIDTALLQRRCLGYLVQLIFWDSRVKLVTGANGAAALLPLPKKLQKIGLLKQNIALFFNSRTGRYLTVGQT